MLRTRKTKVVSASPGAGRRARAPSRGSGWCCVVVLDVAGEHVEPVDLGRRARRRARRGSGRPPSATAAAEPAVSAPTSGLDPMLAQEVPALAEERRLAHRALARPRAARRAAPSRLACTRTKCSPMMCSPELGQQVVDVGDPPVGRILDRQHRAVGRARRAPRRWRASKVSAGQPLEKGKGLDARLMRIGARGALERDPAGQSTHGSLLLFAELAPNAGPVRKEGAPKRLGQSIGRATTYRMRAGTRKTQKLLPSRRISRFLARMTKLVLMHKANSPYEDVPGGRVRLSPLLSSRRERGGG